MSDKDDFEKLYIMLRERFSSKDRVWRMRRKLTATKQGPNEPLDRYIEDLQHMFDNLELTEEEKVWFFTQGLQTNTQKEVLMRQPRTFRFKQSNNQSKNPRVVTPSPACNNSRALVKSFSSVVFPVRLSRQFGLTGRKAA